VNFVIDGSFMRVAVSEHFFALDLDADYFIPPVSIW
jgi:hypothetical protein